MTGVWVGARDIIDHLLDRATFRSWDTPALRVPATAGYPELLEAARARTGLDVFACVLLGQDRIVRTSDTPLGPAVLREAKRGMRLAAGLQPQLVTVIDTPGAALPKEAEEGGLAGEIASCLADLVTIDAPTVSVLLGQGTGRGALALVPTDRVVAARHGWLSPLPPQEASAIVYRNTSHAAEMAAEQGVRAGDLMRAGIVDRIVDERPDAADAPAAFCPRPGVALADGLHQLMPLPPGQRARRRQQRYRRQGL